MATGTCSAQAPPTLDDLVRVTGVPLQKLDEPCSDEHLITISSDLTQWRTVAPYLGLKESDIEEIETDARTESQKRSKALRKWKNKYSFKATYRVLMEALLKCHMADRAEKVCHLLSADPQEPRDSKPVHDENTSSVYVESNIPTTAALVTMAQLKCTVVQERFDQLADGIQTDLLSVARKAFQEKVIPHAKLKVVQNEGISEDSRATTLISAILDQIRQNERVYDTFLSILRAVPAIRWLADNLSKHLQKLQKASNSASGTCTSAASITTSHEPGVSGQEDGDSNKKILRQELDSGVNLPWGRGQELSSVAQELNFTGRIQNSQLVVQSAMSSHYQAVRTLFGVLVTGIQDDVDHLITKAYSCNPRPLIGKDQVDMQQGVSKAQKARSFLGSLLNRIETDPSGESYEIFLKVLSSEEHLVYLAKQIKDEVLRLRISADEHSTGIPRNDRPDGASPFPHSTPTAGDASFGMPKLERREKSVSGIEVTFSLQDVESDEDSQVELAPRSLHRVGRVSSLTDFQQVTPGVVALRDEEDENIPIEESHRDQQAVTDTQEPGADATVNPIVVGDSTDSSINRAHEGLREVVGSAIATLRKEKDDLRSELAESEESERKKDELVQELRQKKNRSEQQLLCKKQELEKIKKEKKSEIDNLKSQLQKKDKVVEMYKEQVAMKKLEKEEEIENRQKWEDRIKALEAQNETVHEKYGKIKETYEDKIRQLEETVKAAEEQKSKAELLKAQIEVQLAQKGKERTEIVLTKEIVIHQLEIQLLKLERELARAEQRKQQNTIAERDATITELRKEILSIKTGDEKPPSENQSKKRTETEPGEVQEVIKPQALLAEHLMVLFELEKALRNGYILTNLTTCLASGAPGVGKTLLRHFLFRELPPLLRISTACIEQAQRAILRALPAGDAECKPVSSKQLKGMIASDLKAGISLNEGQEVPDPLSETLDDQSSHQSGHLEKISVLKPQQPDSTTTSLIPLPSVDMEDNFNIEGNETHDSQSQAQGKHDLPTVSSTTPLKGSTVGDLHQLPETSEIMKLMETSSGSQQLHEVHWVHFIDSGGQAQFMDILPAFARNISLQLPIVKLSEKLADVPAATYYDQGKCHDLGHFIHTNEQLLIQATHFAMFHQPQFPFPNLEHTPDHPKVMVVGTFKDQEKKEETIEDKNKQLMRSLESFQKQQILIPRSDREVIFPVDNTKAGLTPEDPIASELRTAIMKHAPRLRLKMPPQWYLLELELRNLDSKVISKDECWAIAKKLQFESEAAFDAALRYLHEANFFLYYPDILSDIVITDPSAVIDVITQLFEKHIKLQEAPESDSQMISAEDERFHDQAVFTAETIESFNVSYNKALLPNESLVNLLQHRHIVAKITPQTPGCVTFFFMPSLLQESHTSEIIPPGVATPLYIVYPGNQCTPSGLYCAFMVGLLSSKGRFQWQIHSLHSTPIVKLHKNRIDFTINDHPGMVTVVNVITHYEVHPSSEFPANLVHHLLSLIDDSLKLACFRFSYRVAHQFGFPCSCGESPSHTAILIDRTTAIVKCTQNPKYTELMSKKQKLWLPQLKMKQDTSTHHKYDPAHPGVCFLGDPLLESVDSDGRNLPWPDAGISINIPPGAIPKGEIVHMKVWPCLQGPFVMPEGYELVSPVYHISPEFDFKEEVEVHVTHFAVLQSEEDCDAMTFVTAQLMLRSENSYPEYHFRDLKKGRFDKNSRTGTVTLNHFCKLAVARQQHSVEKTEEKNLYSVQFYQDVANQCNRAVFAISLCHPVHSVNLRETLKELFPGVNFWRTAKEPVMMSEKKVKLVLPEVTGWDITPDKIPEEISQYEADLPIHFPDFKSIPEAYPPRILLMIFPVGPDVPAIRCVLKVYGFAEEVGFYLSLKKAQGSAIGGLDTGRSPQVPVAATNALTAQEPLLKDLDLLKVSDWYGVGLQLDVPQCDLDVIKENHHDEKRRKREMFILWLKITDKPSYIKLARALFLAEENNIAHKICKRYGIAEESVKPRTEDL